MAERNQVNIGDFINPPRGEGLTAVRRFVEEMETSKQKEAQQKEEKKVVAQQNTKTPPEKVEKPKMTEEEITDTIDDLERDIEALENSPELTYEERLKKHGVTLEKAEEIIDSLITDGYYEETYAVTKKYTVTFRSRSLEDQNRIFEIIEDVRPNYPSTLNNIVAQYNLAASLISFKGIDFTQMGFEDRLNWIRKCPETVVRALAMKLNKFDAMIMAVMSEGAIENF